MFLSLSPQSLYRHLCSPDWFHFPYIGEGDLPRAPECWDYWCMPLRLVYVVLGIEPRDACMLGKHSTILASPLLTFLCSHQLFSVFWNPLSPCCPIFHLPRVFPISSWSCSFFLTPYDDIRRCVCCAKSPVDASLG